MVDVCSQSDRISKDPLSEMKDMQEKKIMCVRDI